jgi:hypothetical protein
VKVVEDLSFMFVHDLADRLDFYKKYMLTHFHSRVFALFAGNKQIPVKTPPSQSLG